MPTILCVEDETAILEDVVELMEGEGYKTLQACNGKEALEIIIEYAPDLIVSDISMPVMDGRELLEELRKNHPKFDSLPFIFLSALADREEIIAGLKLGADDYITKPIDFDVLANKVESSLRQVKRMQEQKEQQFVKLYNALSKDAGAAQAIVPATKAKPKKVESAVRIGPGEQTAPAIWQEDYFQDDKLDELAKNTSISRDFLVHFIIVNKSLYETKIRRNEVNDLERFSAAIKEQIDKIHIDESAPARLSSWIRRNKGHLVPLTLIRPDGYTLPIKFFNFDDESQQRIKSCFAIFSRANQTKAQQIVDFLTLDLLGTKARNIDRQDIVVVDVHFETLISNDNSALYKPIFLKFAKNAHHKVMMNIREIPSDLTKQRLDKILRPYGKHAAQRMVQIAPRMIEAHAKARLSVSSIVCSYSEMVQFEPDFSLYLKTIQHLSEAGILLYLRDVPSENKISKFRKYGFDGYTVA